MTLRYPVPLGDKDEPVKLQAKEKFNAISNCEHLTPLFAYDYLSLVASKFCFDNPAITVSEFIQYFKTVKELAKKSINALVDSKGNEYHFHPVAYDRWIKVNGKKKFIIKDLLDTIPEIRNSFEQPDNKYPMVFQFCIHPRTPSPKPRIFFFLGNRGIFNIFFFDSIFSFLI